MHSAEIPWNPLACLGGGKCEDMGTAWQRSCAAGLGGGGVRLLRRACARALTDQPAAGLVAVVCGSPFIPFCCVASVQLTRVRMSPSHDISAAATATGAGTSSSSHWEPITLTPLHEGDPGGSDGDPGGSDGDPGGSDGGPGGNDGGTPAHERGGSLRAALSGGNKALA